MNSKNSPTKDIVPTIENPNGNTNAFEEKIAVLQELVHQTKVSMENNVNLVLERGENLERLSDRADTLATGSIEFKRKAEKVKRKTWCEMWKMRMLLGSIISIIIITIIVVPVAKLLHDRHKDNQKTPEFENTTAVFISS